MMKRKVSVILPVYNVEKYIARAIRSVLEQSFNDFELLIIIDGSRDNSKHIAESFADDRIAIYEKENGGLSDARNFGLERANGEFVYFMDSDDWIEPDLLETCIRFLENGQLNIVAFGYQQDNEDINGNVVSSFSVLPGRNEIVRDNPDVDIDRHLIGILGYAWNKVYRRSLLTDNELWFEKGTSLVEDVLFNSQVYQQVNEINFINKAFYHYLNRPVTTLIKQFHTDSFALIVKRTQYLEAFLNNWNVKDRSSLQAFSLIEGIKYCILNLFGFKNHIAFVNKTKLIKEWVNDPYVKSNIKYYEPGTSTDKVYKHLIANKNHFLISGLAYLRRIL